MRVCSTAHGFLDNFLGAAGHIETSVYVDISMVNDRFRFSCSLNYKLFTTTQV
jgi:hypothetical protein